MIYLLIFIITLVFAIFLLKTVFKQLTMKPKQIKFDLKVYFINGYNNYNSVKIQKGECDFKIKDGKLFFIQGENKIEDNIFDIYHIRTWTYENYVYLAIKMKTSSEYKFSLLVKNDVESSIEKALLLGMLKTFENLCKKLKVDFVECGESQSNDDEESEE